MMMNLTIHEETAADFSEIYELVKIAFQTAAHADGDEQDYVNHLRLSENYLPELAFVVKKNSKIIAHLLLTRTFITRSKEKLEALLLSPVCTQLEYRNQGIASLLIKHALTQAKTKGYKAVFLVGEPEYYTRFGFKSISNYSIKDTGNIPDIYTLGLELEEGYLGKKGGKISIQ